MSETPVQLGVLLSTFDTYGVGIGDLAADARRLEDLGVDSIWVGDHLQFNVPMVEAFTVLGAVAAVTSRAQIGTGVLLPALRPPAWVAKQIATVQHLSEGRFVFGLGVGGENPAEWRAADVPVSERGARTDALLRALPDLLAGRSCDLGAPYGYRVEPLEPGCAMPPIWIGGRSSAALSRAARHGATWIGAFAGAKLFRSVRDQLAELAAAEGRSVPALASVLFVHVGDDARAAEEAARQITARQYAVPFEAMDRYIIRGSLDDVAERLGEYVEIGLEHLVVMPVDVEPRRQYEALAELRSLLRRAVSVPARSRSSEGC